MVLRLLKSEVEKFEYFLSNKAATSDDPLLYWENLYHFQSGWNLDTEDLKSMINRAVYNSQSKRFWDLPKQVLLSFVSFNEGFVQIMFKDLFDESKSLAARVDRFPFYCENMLGEMKQNAVKTPSDHHHTTEVVYFYLSMMYPQKYAVYQHNNFFKTLEKIEAKDLPIVFDAERFFKVSSIINKYLLENKNIDIHIDRLLKGSLYYKGENMLRVTYFCWYCANHNF